MSLLRSSTGFRRRYFYKDFAPTELGGGSKLLSGGGTEKPNLPILGCAGAPSPYHLLLTLYGRIFSQNWRRFIFLFFASVGWC